MSIPALEVLFEDNHCLVVNKPAPLLTQAPPGVPSLEALAKDWIRTKYAKAGNIYLGVPHRLDRPVSGVVAFARTSKAASRLAEQFRDRQVVKIYWGLVEGTVTPEAGEWRDVIRKVKEESRAETAEAGTEGAKLAVLRYRVLQRFEGQSTVGRVSRPVSLADPNDANSHTPKQDGSGDPSYGGKPVTLVEFAPETGRMHQIRIQACQHGHPLVGDSAYGSTQEFGPPAESPRDRIIALHARSLTFLHPIRYEPVRVVAPLPAYWNLS
jgi:23S rRNA pseudouridine1911/1915/1917 synthase